MLHRERRIMRILVTDGNERAALAAVRSLVHAGHSVVVCTPAQPSLAGVSRGARSRRLTTDPLADPAAYTAELSRIAREHSTDVLLPMTDPSVEAVLEHRDAFPSATAIPLPDLATYRAASDKAHVMALAEQCGFGVPETRVLATAADPLPDAAFFPAVVKPHRSVVSVRGVRRKAGVTPVGDLAACRRALAALPAAAFPVLLQRHVSGVGEGFFALRWGGRMVATFAHRRLREKPPSGGVSVYRESIPLEAGLAGPGARLLEMLDWNGVAMIECKREESTGRQVIMEINGRFWGSLQLAIDAGVDFPSLLARCATGETVLGPREYRIGVRSRWFWGDVDHLYLRLRSGGSRLHALRDFLRGNGGGEVWRWRDPAPFVVETLQWFGLIPRTGGAR
jgi:predicted ATP-grasp superfamily ATP-dependent carboligase